MQKEYPELAIDGEMQVNFAMNRELRDAKYPFTRLKGKDVNTLIFPNLSPPMPDTNCYRPWTPIQNLSALSRWD